MWADELKQALECLYDPLALSQLAICRRFERAVAESDSHRRAQAMRSILLDAIEVLQPPSSAMPLTPSLRGYELLSLHYVQRLSFAEASEELHISPRQAYRDLAAAVERLADYLSELAARQPAQAEEEPVTPSLQAELKRLGASKQETDLWAVVLAAVETVKPLADMRGTTIGLPAGESVFTATVEPALFRQVLVSLLSWALRHTSQGGVTLTGRQERNSDVISLRFRTGTPLPTLAEEVVQLCRSQGMRLALSESRAEAEVELHVPRQGKRLILIVEDNPAVVQFYQRLLQDTGRYELVAAPDSQSAPTMARTVGPDAVILDVLMPELDGWSVLRSLRELAETRGIPVLICSVFDEPELAQALGATACLKKPITAPALLQALERCLERGRSPQPR